MVSAFSVPKASRQEKTNNHPGPGQYNPQHSPKHIKPTDPLYSFGKDVRKNENPSIPGPGAYELKQNLVTHKKPSFSMLSRHDLSQSKIEVGPGQYSPHYIYGKQKSPAFTMRGKYGQKPQVIPGPGQYVYRSNIFIKEKGHDFGKQMRSKQNSNKVPGPGSYEYETAVFKYGSKNEPSYGFGSRLAYNTDGKFPGPGSYQPKKEVYSHIGGIVGKDLRDSLVMTKTPGPGNYENSASFKEKAPMWSLSKSERDKFPTDKYNIGPGQYDLIGFKRVVEHAPAYNIGGKTQKLKYDINNVPGPGSYERQFMKSRKSIKIGQKIKDVQNLKVPGPGSYEQLKYDNDSWLKGSGRYSVAKDQKFKSQASLVPGPGAYQNKTTDLKAPKGKVTFGQQAKLKQQESKHPGPGHYELKPTFADVPKYLLPNS